MINKEALDKIQVLGKEYERTWGKKVDYTILPKGISQEKLVGVLEIMTDTGDSLLVAYNKYKETQ